MDATQILHELASADGMPVEAIRAASANRAAVAPAFVQVIERFVAGEYADADADALFLVFHLLGEWREKSAYRPLAALLHLVQVVHRPLQLDLDGGQALADLLDVAQP